MKKLIVGVAIGVFFAIGCNHNSGEKSADPLTMLGSPQAATNYDYPFWNDQFQRKTDTWRKALTFCKEADHKFLINCQPVLAVAAPRLAFPTAMPPHEPGRNFGFAPAPSPGASHPH